MMLLKVSAAWANKVIDCTVNGIVNGCHARCCKGNIFYPSKSHMHNGASIGFCYWLGRKGCELLPRDRPIKCLLYPFIINANNTLVLHGKAITSICKECYNRGDKSIIETQFSNLCLVFGKSMAELILDTVRNQKVDFTFKTSSGLDKAIALEDELERQNIVPIPRSNKDRSYLL